MGGAGGVVEIDETYIGRKDGFEIKRGSGHKNSVLTLVERNGKARSFHVEKASRCFSPGICWSGLSLNRWGCEVHALQTNS